MKLDKGGALYCLELEVCLHERVERRVIGDVLEERSESTGPAAECMPEWLFNAIVPNSALADPNGTAHRSRRTSREVDRSYRYLA